MTDGDYHLSTDSSNAPSIWVLLPPEGAGNSPTLTRLDVKDEYTHLSTRETAITRALLQHALDQIDNPEH